jgi:sterol 3beta-glucosyltransferase
MPLMGFPKLSLPGYNKMTYRLGEQIVWQMFRPVINRWRTQTLKLSPLPLKGYFDQLGTRRFPVLNGFSPSVVSRPADWNEHIHVTGYWFPEDTQWEPPKDLLTSSMRAVRPCSLDLEACRSGTAGVTD